MNKIAYIYSLSCPITNEIRYIGRTVGNPKYRYSNHLCQAETNIKKDYCHCWIKKLLSKNLKPVMAIIEETYDLSREKYWINYYFTKGCKLTNLAEGGEKSGLGSRRTKEQKENISKGLLKNSKRQIYELNTDLSVKAIWKSYKQISDYVGTTTTDVYTATKRFTRVKGIYFVLKEDYADLLRITNYKNNIIQVINVETNEIFSYKYWKDFQTQFNCSKKIIENYANKNKFYLNKYKIIHNKYADMPK